MKQATILTTLLALALVLAGAGCTDQASEDPDQQWISSTNLNMQQAGAKLGHLGEASEALNYDDLDFWAGELRERTGQALADSAKYETSPGLADARTEYEAMMSGLDQAAATMQQAVTYHGAGDDTNATEAVATANRQISEANGHLEKFRAALP